jgi:hypothetical protein
MTYNPALGKHKFKPSGTRKPKDSTNSGVSALEVLIPASSDGLQRPGHTIVLLLEIEN